jgi:uncharacterized protein (DUF58 family)
MVREFETDTDRTVWLCLDTSASMSYRGPGAQAAKLAYAALLAAASCRIAIAGHDPVGLCWLGAHDRGNVALAPGFGALAFERVVHALEGAQAGGNWGDDVDALDRELSLISRRARRGSIVLMFSDFLDVPERAMPRVAAVAAKGVLVAVQVLDPVEIDFPFAGKVLLRAIESDERVTTDADRVREEYKRRLEAHTGSWRRAIETLGGRLVRASSGQDAVAAVRRIVQAVAEARS